MIETAPHRIRAAVISSSIAAALGLAATQAAAASAELCTGEICVSDPWARATPPGTQTGAVFFSVINKGRTPDALVSATSSVTADAMVHRSVVTGNIARMEMTGPVQLAPGAHLTFAPVGYHLMLGGLKQRLTEGSSISVTLDFARAGKLTVPVPVLGVAALGPKSNSNDH